MAAKKKGGKGEKRAEKKGGKGGKRAGLTWRAVAAEKRYCAMGGLCCGLKLPLPAVSRQRQIRVLLGVCYNKMIVLQLEEMIVLKR